MTLDTDIAFSDGAQQASIEHVLSVRREVVFDDSAAARAERQSFHMLVLRHCCAYRKGRRSRFGFDVADCEFTDM